MKQYIYFKKKLKIKKIKKYTNKVCAVRTRAACQTSIAAGKIIDNAAIESVLKSNQFK